MTNWGCGWECECSEHTRQEARQRYKEYVENVGGRCAIRLEKHREKIEEVSA